MALSDHEATAILHQGTGVAALAAVAKNHYAGSTTAPVSLVRCDHYAVTHAWPHPTVLKIDVEGYESAVLDGFGTLLRGVRVVSLEIHPGRLLPGETPETVVARLTQAGLQVVACRAYQHESHLLASRTV